MNKQKGFTLIELLVVIAIIGILSTLAVVSLNNARQKARDAKIVSDVKNIQTALELYFNDTGAYPQAANFSTTSPLSFGSTTYMEKIPRSPLNVDYVYTLTTVGNGTPTYTLSYSLEGATGGITAGAHTASPASITNP
jgi:general secretion pathway protein G